MLPNPPSTSSADGFSYATNAVESDDVAALASESRGAVHLSR